MKSNQDLVEATFVFPNKKDDSYLGTFGPITKLGIHHFNVSSPVLTPDLLRNSVPKRSVNKETLENTTSGNGRNINGLITNYTNVNESNNERKTTPGDVDKE